MIVKRIVCLANSRKLSGRCVAGKEASAVGAWIRPVSARETEEVSLKEQQYANGEHPQLLDVVEIPLLEPKPKHNQVENWRFAPLRRWVKAGRVSWESLAQMADPVSPLWVNGGSTRNGLNDRMPVDAAHAQSDSLRLINVPSLELVETTREGFLGEERRLQARFSYAGASYVLSVTDPLYEAQYRERPLGSYLLGPCFVTVSIGDPFEGYCYKLIAGIVEQR